MFRFTVRLRLSAPRPSPAKPRAEPAAASTPPAPRRLRILVGEDAKKIDEWVRRTPEQAYDVDFFERFAAEAGWKIAR